MLSILAVFVSEVPTPRLMLSITIMDCRGLIGPRSQVAPLSAET